MLLKFTGIVRAYSSVSLCFGMLLTQTVNAAIPTNSWKDSYSQDGQCYCLTSFDHDIGPVLVDTLQGPKTVLEICNTIGAGPGEQNNPVYNDVQCGNGPANSAADETVCPGRVDMGDSGCSIIGPTWNLEQFFPAPVEPVDPTPPEPTPIEPATNPEPPVTVPEPVPEVAPRGALFEAENFNSADVQWVIIRTTDDYSADPFWTDSDAPHTQYASGGLYVEVLPDRKVNDIDPVDVGVWPTPGEGPQIHYAVDFPAAGRYSVAVKGYSTGANDNQVHVGINGSWPDSGRNIQFCGPKNQWVWSGCEGLTTASLTVPGAGTHAVQFSAFEDGFEMDQFVLSLVESVATPAAPASNPATDTGSGSTQSSSQASSQNQAGQSPAASGNDSEQQATDPELGQAISVGGPSAFGSGSIHPQLLMLFSMLLLVRRSRRQSSVA